MIVVYGRHEEHVRRRYAMSMAYVLLTLKMEKLAGTLGLL